MDNQNKEITIVNSTSIINELNTDTFTNRGDALAKFKDYIKDTFKDGIDFGIIPNTDRPCLLKPGFEKIQFLLGLTPQYKLIKETFTPNQPKKYKKWNDKTKAYEVVETIRNYYSWQFACELYHGDVKVAEGVGCANTEEKKYVSQYEKSETPDSLANTVMKIAKKRALGDAILNVGGISDLYTVDLEDNETINKLKTDKTTKTNKLTKEQIKTIYATIGALQIVDDDFKTILNELGYLKIQDVKPEDAVKITEKIKALAKSRKG